MDAVLLKMIIFLKRVTFFLKKVITNGSKRNST